MKAQVRERDDGRWVWRVVDDDGEIVDESGATSYGDREDAEVEAKEALLDEESAWEDV